MTNPIPVIQPQPNQAAYGLDVLKLAKEYDRAGYSAAFGVDPPTYDPSKPTKTWTLQVSDPYTYISFVVTGLALPDRRAFMLSAADALAVNMPGAHSYPAYVVDPTTAREIDLVAGITVNPLPPEELSTRDQAIKLAADFGMNSDAVVDMSLKLGIYQTIYPPTELRRRLAINFKGTNILVGKLLVEKYANGAPDAQGKEAPGVWHLDGPEPNWISGVISPANLPPPNPSQPVPMRDLLSNEKFNVALTGVEIVRTDLGTVNPNPAGGGLTGDQDAVLRRIDANVAAFKSAFGV